MNQILRDIVLETPELTEPTRTFREILASRHSIRAFKPDPVPLELVKTLLAEASMAPSSTNTQPWRVSVVTGAARERLVGEILAYRETSPPDDKAEFPQYFWDSEPYLSRARKLGKDMYTALDIPRGSSQARWDQWGRNYKFFDAPVGMVFTLDKILDRMNYIDLGIFLQTLIIAAQTRGLGTCAHGAWHDYWSVTRRVLEIPDDQYVVVGLSLGYADPEAAINFLHTDREPVDRFARFHGFE